MPIASLWAGTKTATLGRCPLAIFRRAGNNAAKHSTKRTAGQVGFVIAGMKSTKEARVGDTFYHIHSPVEALPGFKAAKPMVFAGIYPIDASELEKLQDAIQKLTLNDASVTVQKESRYII